MHAEAGMRGIFCWGTQGLEDLSEAESRELMVDVFKISQPLLAGQLQWINPWVWEIKAGVKDLKDLKGLKGLKGLKTYPFKKIVGREMAGYMPFGPDSSKWRRWMTEMQMFLHDHPVNQNRQKLGQKTVDWIWLENSKSSFFKRNFHSVLELFNLFKLFK